MSEAIPAATLILFRPAEGGPDRHLMIERAAAMAFAGGALVFPGGRVDPGDHALALLLGTDDPDEDASRIAAIRETIEETGLAPAIDPPPSADTIARWRAGLASGTAFATLLAEDGHRLQLDRLAPFARWRPNFRETRTFDTRFYCTEAPDADTPLADGGESVHAFWADAATVLAEADAGHHRLIFPTRRNLERLASLGNLPEVRAQLAAQPARLIEPWLEEREGEKWLCIPGDLGYPVTAERLAKVMRG